jgi:hypothetical protein
MVKWGKKQKGFVRDIQSSFQYYFLISAIENFRGAGFKSG